MHYNYLCLSFWKNCILINSFYKYFQNVYILLRHPVYKHFQSAFPYNKNNFNLEKIRWMISNLCWKLILFAKRIFMPLLEFIIKISVAVLFNIKIRILSRWILHYLFIFPLFFNFIICRPKFLWLSFIRSFEQDAALQKARLG